MPETPPPIPKKPSTVTFYFEKAPCFQSLHADGAVGSLTPAGQAFIAFYVERAPIPKSIVYPVTADGNVAEQPTSMTGKQGVFREIQTAVILTPKALNALKLHIDRLISLLDQNATDLA